MAATVEQRLTQAAMAIMNHPKWCMISGVMLLGKTTVSETCPTAATNGRDEIYGRKFVDTLTQEELRFLRMHEAMHKAYRHLTTYKFLHVIDARMANAAMDYVINIMLVDGDASEGFIKMPKVGLVDTKYRGWNTKQVFDDLMQQKKDKGTSGKDESEGGDGQGQKSTSGDDLDEHDFDGAESMSEEDKNSTERDIEVAIRQGALLAGKGAGKESRDLMDTLDSQIRWQEILAEFVKSFTKGKDNSSWAKVNRRWVSQGLYLPSTVSESVGSLLVGIDASGSTWSGNQLEGFVGELIAICKDCTPESVDVVWWDTEVTSVQSYQPEEYDSMKLTLKIAGGGGTRPSCVTDWIQKDGAGAKRDYVAAIMLSDGLVGNDWGEWQGLPVLWALNQKGITAGTGQTVYIEEV